MQLDKPNVVLPLAASYNPRGIAGFDTTVTNATDQRKINSLYKPVQNPITGKTTLYLVKRGGVADLGSTYGDTDQVAHLWEVAPGATSNAAANYWVFYTDGNDINASSTTTDTTILTAANYAPAFVDKTHLSGTENLVIQLRRSSDFDQRVYFSTAIGTFTEITDAEFAALTHIGKMEFMDGYAFIMDRATNSIFNSDINSLANWGATSFIRKQIVQDLPKGLARFGNQIIAFGAATMEVFRNAGLASGSPLETIPQLAQRHGLTDPEAGQHYYAEMDGRLYWPGTGPGGIYAYDGARVEKVSTPFIDSIINDRTVTHVGVMGGSGFKGISFALDARGASTQRWLMFMPDWNEWFEWNSTVFQPVSSQRNSLVFLGTGTNADKLYQGSTTTDNWQDAGTNYTWTHQFQVPSDGNHRKRMSWCGLKGDTARSALNISVEFSDDDYQTFSTARNIDMTSKKKAIYRCGSFQTERVVRLSHTGNLEVRLEKFLARIE